MVEYPSFLIIGAAKCGTTSLFKYLSVHPNIYMPQKEIHYFDNPINFKNINYATYTKKFATQNTNITQTGEATPVYCFLPEAITRIHQFNSKLKLIMLVRDPVWRAVSNYYMEYNRQREKLSLLEAIDKEPKRHRVIHSYCARGHYADQLDHIYSLFPKSQVLIIRLEDLSSRPQMAMDQITQFLEVPSFSTDYRPHFTGAYPTPSKEALKILADHFKPHNERLHQKYGIKISDWT
jgi:hypothetical protein